MSEMMSEMRYDQAHKLARKVYEQFVVPFSRIHEVLELVLQAEADEARLRALCVRHEEAIKTQSQAYLTQAQEFESRRLSAETKLAQLTGASGKLEAEILDLRRKLGDLSTSYEDQRIAALREHEDSLMTLSVNKKEEVAKWEEKIFLLRTDYESLRSAIAKLIKT